MTPFNGNSAKYRSACCCGAHVTTLSRVLVMFTFLSSLLAVFDPNPIGLIGVALSCLGLISIFYELRALLLIFYLIFSMIYATLFLAAKPENRGQGEAVLIGAMLAAIVAVAIKIPFFITYWNLAKFIADREDASQVHVQYGVCLDSNPAAAPVAATVPSPSAPADPNVSEPPPPYDEKYMA